MIRGGYACCHMYNHACPVNCERKEMGAENHLHCSLLGTALEVQVGTQRKALIFSKKDALAYLFTTLTISADSAHPNLTINPSTHSIRLYSSVGQIYLCHGLPYGGSPPGHHGC